MPTDSCDTRTPMRRERLYVDSLGNPKGYSEELITYVTDRAGHDLRYAIDSNKLKDELGWTPSLQFEEGLQHTVRWYLSNQEWIELVSQKS